MGEPAAGSGGPVPAAPGQMVAAGRRRVVHRRRAALHDHLQVSEGAGGGLELHGEGGGGGGVLAPRRGGLGRGDGERGRWCGW